MPLKNKINQAFGLITVLLLGLMVLVGCGGSKDSSIIKEVNPQIKVMDIGLLMDEQVVKEKLGSAEKAMCVYGYEYDYADKDINVGFAAKTSQVRRITTKNPETSIYGIKPGAKLSEAYQTLASQGFKKADDSKYVFNKDNLKFSIISMKGTRADGITIEINPESK